MTLNETKSKYDPELAEDFELYLSALWPKCPNDIGLTLAIMAHKFYGTEGHGIEIEYK